MDQKSFCTKIFPYIFLIKPLFFFLNPCEVISSHITLNFKPLKAELIRAYFNISTT